MLEMDTKYCRSTSPTVLDKHAALRSGQRLVRGMLSALLCLGAVAGMPKDFVPQFLQRYKDDAAVVDLPRARES